MAIKTVSWTSFGRLSCSGCTPADVILCTTFDGATVPAQLLSTQRLSTGCGGGYFQYSFSYDTDDLPQGVTGLTCANITNAFCKGCLTEWVEEQIAAAVADITVDIAAVQAEVDALEIVVAAQQVEIDLLEANPKAETIGLQSYLDSYSFIANPGTPVELDLILTNPSSVNSMAVDADWGWDLSLVSSTSYGPSGATSVLFEDAVLVPNSSRGASESWSPAATRAVNFVGAQGHHHLILAPSESVTLTLEISEAGGGPGPDISWAATKIFVSAFGVTI